MLFELIIMKRLIVMFSIFILMLNAVPHTPVASSNELLVVYDILNDQNATVTWWGDEQLKYNFSSEDDLKVKIHDMSDPNTLLDLEIGNLTVYNVTDNLASTNLALGYWKIPAELGFVANSTWNATKQQVSNLNLTVNSYAEYVSDDYFGVSLSVVRIEIQDFYQTSTFVYHKADGLLLSANTTVLGYTLEMKIKSINDKTDYYSNEVTNNPTSSGTSSQTTPKPSITTTNKQALFPVFSLLVLLVPIYRRKLFS